MPAFPAPDVELANPLDELVGYQLRRASAWVLADLAGSLSELALRPAEASMILIVQGNPEVTQSDLGRVLGIQRANMAPLAAGLTERGLIGRSRANGRSQGLRLSAEGEAMALEICSRIASHEARLLPDLSTPEREALVALLRRIWTTASSTRPPHLPQKSASSP